MKTWTRMKFVLSIQQSAMGGCGKLQNWNPSPSHPFHFARLHSNVSIKYIQIFLAHTLQLCIISSDHLVHVNTAWYVYFPLSRSLCVWAASMRIKHFLFCLFDLSEFVFTFLFSFSFLLVNFVSEKKHQFQIIEKKIKNNQI